MAQVHLFDTHCHIHEADMADPSGSHTQQMWHKLNKSYQEIVDEGQTAGVKEFMLVGCSVTDSKLAVKIASGQSESYASIGIHPHEATKALDNKKELDDFTELAASSGVTAIGECGLDYFYEFSPRDKQIELLHFQLKLAKQHNLPVIFHVRGAYEDFWPIYEQYAPLRGILHSFTDTEANLQQALKHGLYIGVNGIATFTKDLDQQAMYRAIPLTNLVLETDAPYLTPVPYRGRINELKHVREVAEYMAKIQGVSLDDLASVTTANAQAAFNL